ncbi:nucleotide sugar dehydrogenase family protein [Synechococcus sp. Minos11]|uniref:nucleotide sugar dehydrogenase n=1 Tax=Synechococcus sp. Minos11 TaxID=221341 RepID=UPI001648233F|nr:nucleotide sugar dehydrogenase [Synechococcus sp. Minos11]QNJ07703.1 nucleotide sugar dehydrogenase family protein [Synechococcus sp. Minos11]
MSNFRLLADSISNKSATIGVIGLGYVGLPLSLAFADAGYKVIGFDINDDRVRKLNSQISYIDQIKSSSIAKASSQGFSATSDFSLISSINVIILCVPTPLTLYREPDLQPIKSTLVNISRFLSDYQLLILESTTYPGTCDEVLYPFLKSAGFQVGSNFYLSYSPERVDPGNTTHTLAEIPKVVGGYSQNCLELSLLLYKSIVPSVIPVSSLRAAEMTKLLENIHRCVNIGLVNEMKIVADKMGIDIHEVVRAASTKPFGFTPYFPGPGLGGHCIPIDPFYLTWKAREFNIHTRFIELAGEVNTSMPDWVISKVSYALNSKCLSINSSKILILGLSYKKDVDDIRESPAVALLQKLSSSGAILSYSDPYISSFLDPLSGKSYISSHLYPDFLSSQDLVLIATNHSSFDYNLILNHSSTIVDTRGVYDSNLPNIIAA